MSEIQAIGADGIVYQFSSSDMDKKLKATQKALALAKGELKKIEVAGRGGWENAIAIQALRQIAEIERGGE